jgi:hypothetical protein
MEVLKIVLRENEDNQLRIITESPNVCYDHGIDFDEGYPEVAQLTRNHLLGVIADMDWDKWIRRTVNEKAGLK